MPINKNKEFFQLQFASFFRFMAANLSLTHLQQHPGECAQDGSSQIAAPVFQGKIPLSKSQAGLPAKSHKFTDIVYHGNIVLSSTKL